MIQTLIHNFRSVSCPRRIQGVSLIDDKNNCNGLPAPPKAVILDFPVQIMLQWGGLWSDTNETVDTRFHGERLYIKQFDSFEKISIHFNSVSCITCITPN
jgi:hypothetical protein